MNPRRKMAIKVYIIYAIILLGLAVILHWAGTQPVPDTDPHNKAQPVDDPTQTGKMQPVQAASTTAFIDNPATITETVYDETPGVSASPKIRLPVLMYHHISFTPQKFHGRAVTPERFREDMLYVKALGWTPIDTRDITAHLQGRKPLPERAVLITFDDGYRSNYQYAYPVLKELGLKAVFNIIGTSVGRELSLFDGEPIIPHFSWEEAKEMAESGHVDFQSHSFDLHRPGKGNGTYGKGVMPFWQENAEKYEARFRKDVLTNQQYIRRHTGGPVVLYSYPYGLYNEVTERVLKELGYTVTLTVRPGVAEVSDGFFRLNRFAMDMETESPDHFRYMLELMEDPASVPFAEIEEARERIRRLEALLEL